MPTRRRKFSVQNERCSRPKRPQSTICHQVSLKNNTAFNPTENGTNGAKNTATERASENQSLQSQDVNSLNSNNISIECSSIDFQEYPSRPDQYLEREPRPGRSHYPLHAAKVRSPKRRPESVIPTSSALAYTSRATTAAVAHISKCTSSSGLILASERDTYTDISEIPLIISPAINSSIIEDVPSTYSFEDMCRICHSGESVNTEFGQLLSACACRGTVGRVHVKCLERWLTESGKSRCELCGTRYATRRVHKYGVAKALLMWMMSHNAKQLIVDSLGIMLMSPLAVLAAWLSGRTLAGLMSQEVHVTPWPLASTFVLACMTLVCYYCWIVSAATRHALRWWLWYRAQYEVRLQMQEENAATEENN